MSFRPASSRKQDLIVLRRLGLVVEQPGADDKLGVFGIDAREVEIFEDRQVALRPEMEDARAGVLGELMAGQIAGGDRGVVALLGNAEACQLPL